MQKLLPIFGLALLSYALTGPALALSPLPPVDPTAWRRESGLDSALGEYQRQHVIDKFYTAFANHDADTMAAQYHKDIEFNDPVFGTLRGPAAGAMWKMLLAASENQLVIKHDQVSVSQQNGRARWQAWYPAPLTAYPVHNVIEARFEFKDGLIYRHYDSFDMNRWTCMALGLPGCLLGGQPWLQGVISAQAQRRLADWLRTHPQGAVSEPAS